MAVMTPVAAVAQGEGGHRAGRRGSAERPWVEPAVLRRSVFDGGRQALPPLHCEPLGSAWQLWQR